MNKKNFVIVSQRIFPAQSPRSFRATELAKELARQGHRVTLYAVLGKYDYKTFESVNNIKVKNIGRLLFAKANSDVDIRFTLLDKILYKILNKILEFPDIELMFKIPGILKKEKNVDCLITVAIPFPLHWGAALAKTIYPKRFPKKWIADCGDPYMGNKFSKPYFYFGYLEKWFCRKVDYISVPVEEARPAYYEEFHEKIKIIPQGFNLDEIPKVDGVENNDVPTFAYAGTFYKGVRDPKLFLRYITSLDKEFKFIIFSPGNSFIETYKEILDRRIELKPFIARKELLNFLVKTDFVVNFENSSDVHSPSKLIEYALIEKPILSIRCDQIEENIINEFLEGKYDQGLVIANLQQYDIKNVATKFVELASEQVNIDR